MSIQFETFRGTGGGAVTGGLVYKGSYNATTSSPSLVTATKGDFYIVSVGGTLAGVTLNVGDHIVFNQDSADPVTSAMFDVIDNTDAVSSVNGQTGVITLGASDVNALAIASNLSDLNNAGTARTNLGLGTSAVINVGTGASQIVQLDGSSRLPAVDGSQLTNVTSTDTSKLAIASNLSDLNNVATARTNLGLGTSAVIDVGTGASEVVQLDGSSRLPAVDGSQLTNVTGTDATKLAIASNLSDLNNAGTARTNLGLGTSAVIDVGTGASQVVQLDGSSRLPAVDGSQLTNVTSTDTSKLAIASNLSDLNNVATARTNLGLGTSAVIDVGTGASEIVQLDGSSRLPAVDGSQLTNVTSTDTSKLAIASNLSDLNNVATARTNLGLGTAATKNTGTSNGNVVLLDAVGLPAVNGSQLTNVTGTDATKLAITNNLSDLNSASTARTNLGLGTSAVIDVGTGASQIVQLDGSSRLPAVDGSQLTNLPSSGGGFTYSAIVTGDSPVSGAVSTHYSANTSGGAITINLPALAGGNAGKEIRVKLKTAGNTLTLDGNASETIDGSTTYTLTVQNQAVTLVSDGSSNWEVI